MSTWLISLITGLGGGAGPGVGGDIAGSGVGGAVLMLIIGLIKQMMAGKKVV